MNSKWMRHGIVWSSLFLVLAGCDGSKPASKPSAGASAEKPAGDSKPESKEEKSLAGKWRVELIEEGSAREFAVIEVSPPDAQGKRTLTPLIMAASFDGAKLKSASAEGDTLQMTYLAGDGVTLSFHARLTSKGLGGYVLVSKILAAPVQFVKTEVETLENTPGGTPVKDADILEKAAGTPDALEDFIQRHPDSPLLLNAYPILIAHLKNGKAKKEDVEKVRSDMLKAADQWGGPVKVRVDLDVAMMLIRMQMFPELAKAYLDDFQKQLKPDYPTSWLTELALARVQLGQPKEAITLLTSASNSGPQDLLVNYVLARAYEADHQAQKALELFAKMSVIPYLEQMLVDALPEVSKERPSQATERLWKEIHKSDEGLAKYLADTYTTEIANLTPPREQIAPRPQNARVSLMELFTGTSCPPCVAADITMSGIHHHYQPSEVIVLKYHEHIPAPDPFATELTMKRFMFYQLQGTPTGVLDGKIDEELPGSALIAPARYLRLRQQIDPGLQRTTPIQIELSAISNQGKIRIKANVVGENFSDDTRLRLALIENGIHFKAPNGIRVHDCVVRTMPGGVEGIAPKDKKLSFEGEIVLADLKSSIEKEIGKLEEKVGTLFAQPVNLKQLQLAAFVQDDSSKEVLQAKLIDIAGIEGGSSPPQKPSEAKPVEKPAETKPSEKPAEAKPAESKPVEKAPEKK